MRVYQLIIAIALLSSCAEFVTMTESSPGARLAAAGHRVIAYYPGWTSEGRNPYRAPSRRGVMPDEAMVSAGPA